MSRILPIKKSLDDKYINETDVITESALAQLIENQGVGVLVLSRELNSLPDNTYYNRNRLTKSEFAQAAGVAEELVDTLFDENTIIFYYTENYEVRLFGSVEQYDIASYFKTKGIDQYGNNFISIYIPGTTQGVYPINWTKCGDYYGNSVANLGPK